MKTKYKYLVIGVLLVVFSINWLHAQEKKSEDNKKLYSKLAFFDYRGTNAIDVAIGTSIISGDIPEPKFEIYFKIGYKRHVTDNLNINFTYNKYSLAFKDISSEGFMSFDLNIEYLFSPYKVLSPFVQIGYGYNAADDFKNKAAKAQGALGIEYIVMDGLGLKFFGEYNYVFSDELNGLIVGESNDTFLRMGLGINLYFGGNMQKQKLLSYLDTVIKSNLVR
ncbi:Curli production assembly/transport component CsgG [uncultured Winogradskyella sp.]|uniref:Curli production assembly/transport component CsgG n=1 Tax=uncultured Winogradskyella sp. TaxID=395353 RepID=UPI0030D70573|tara:strand:+ start:11717 stop:12382 length:666 start_codon:yes stop_codon:yes gene_type:complete